MGKTALLLVGFNRPENLRLRLIEISKNMTIQLIVSLDGGAPVDASLLMIKYVTDFKNANPEFLTKLIIRDQNLGLAKHITTAISEVFENFNYCIVVEDDISISDNFVKNMLNGREVFEKSNALTIGGFSPFIPYAKIRVSRNFFRESKYFSAWGWMISKEKWAEYELELPKFQIESALSTSVTWKKLSKNQKKIWLRRFSKVANNNPRTWDCQMQFLSFKKDLLNVLPTYQICDNLGFNDIRSTHTKERRPKWMKNPGQLRSETLSFDKIISIETKTGKFLNYLDSVFISGDARIVTIRNFISKLRKIRL